MGSLAIIRFTHTSVRYGDTIPKIVIHSDGHTVISSMISSNMKIISVKQEVGEGAHLNGSNNSQGE